MCRSDGEFISLNTYVPAGSTLPGISTGPLNVRMVFLSNSSAAAGRAKGMMTAQAIVAIIIDLMLVTSQPQKSTLRAMRAWKPNCRVINDTHATDVTFALLFACSLCLARGPKFCG